IAKYSGGTWAALDTGVQNFSVRALELDGSNNLYAGGFFYMAGGISADKIARWYGVEWSGLGSGLSYVNDSQEKSVYALLADTASGVLYVGGNFIVAGNQVSAYLAKWLLLDSDNDGTGDEVDTDNDNDGVPDINDAFPLDPAEWLD